jgi:glucosamine-6-phosphate deaminase
MELLTKKVEELKVYVWSDRQSAGAAAGKETVARIKRLIEEKGEARVLFAAAPSQDESLAYLKDSDVDWSKVRAFHLDEYVDLRADHPARFGAFLNRALFDHVKFKSVHYLYQEGLEPNEMVKQYTDLLAKFPLDLMLLGVGENGHLAFNDPAVADFEDPAVIKIVDLDDTCRMQQVNDGCFKSFDEVPKHAMTVTLSALAKIPEYVALVPGIRKAKAVNCMINGPLTTECPASMLRTLPGGMLFLDKDSASLAFNL